MNYCVNSPYTQYPDSGSIFRRCPNAGLCIRGYWQLCGDSVCRPGDRNYGGIRHTLRVFLSLPQGGGNDPGHRTKVIIVCALFSEIQMLVVYRVSRLQVWLANLKWPSWRAERFAKVSSARKVKCCVFFGTACIFLGNQDIRTAAVMRDAWLPEFIIIIFLRRYLVAMMKPGSKVGSKKKAATGPDTRVIQLMNDIQAFAEKWEIMRFWAFLNPMESARLQIMDSSAEHCL